MESHLTTQDRNIASVRSEEDDYISSNAFLGLFWESAFKYVALPNYFRRSNPHFTKHMAAGTRLLEMFELGPVIQKQVLDCLERLTETSYRHSIQLDQLDARTEHLRSKGAQEERSASVFIETLGATSKILERIESQPENRQEVLYCLMELEQHLGYLEKSARSIGKIYESRMAATLKNICKIHEPVELTEDQLKYFTAGARSFINGWGALTKEKIDYIRSSLLSQKLTWLPVTPKAEKVIEENRRRLDEGAIS